jgi:hypothetical protein
VRNRIRRSKKTPGSGWVGMVGSGRVGSDRVGSGRVRQNGSVDGLEPRRIGLGMVEYGSRVLRWVGCGGGTAHTTLP